MARNKVFARVTVSNYGHQRLYPVRVVGAAKGGRVKVVSVSTDHSGRRWSHGYKATVKRSSIVRQKLF